MAKSVDSDDADAHEDSILEAIGYKQELKRGFSTLMSVSFCFTAVAVLSSTSMLFSFGLQTGGPAAIIFGWVVTSVFSILTGLALAELCSTLPCAGSIYYYAGQLCPPQYAPLLSYVTGWFNFIGNSAGVCSFAFGFAESVSSAYTVSTGHPNFSIQHLVLLSIATSFVWALLNVLKVDRQGWLANFAALFQVFSSLGIVLALLTSHHQTASFVFTTYHNKTGFSSVGYVLLLGLLFSTFSFSGYESGAHMAEETRNASKAAPWGIVITVLMVAAVGFIYVLGLLLSTDDIDSVIDNGIVQVYLDACGRRAGLFMAVLLIINLFFAGMSSLTVTSRIGFAMARDGAFPGSAWLRVVNQTVKMPLRMVALVFGLNILILLIPLGSAVAFTAVRSITTIGFQISYACPIILRVTIGRRYFRQSEFHLGRYSEAVHWAAGIWLLVTSTMFICPTRWPITAANMNYTLVVLGAVATIGAVYWQVWAKYFFRGPPRDAIIQQLDAAEASAAAQAVARNSLLDSFQAENNQGVQDQSLVELKSK